jgi:hypothetical protein
MTAPFIPFAKSNVQGTLIAPLTAKFGLNFVILKAFDLRKISSYAKKIHHNSSSD